jgi:hypothetical protein
MRNHGAETLSEFCKSVRKSVRNSFRKRNRNQEPQIALQGPASRNGARTITEYEEGGDAETFSKCVAPEG